MVKICRDEGIHCLVWWDIGRSRVLALSEHFITTLMGIDPVTGLGELVKIEPQEFLFNVLSNV